MFRNESEYEKYIRRLIDLHVTAVDPRVYALKNKKAVDILICRDAPEPELFFIEVKFHQEKHGRLGFGSRAGDGFQPEIVSRKPAYFERNLRWVLGCDEHPGKILFTTSEVIRQYLSGGAIGKKFNNIQKMIFREEVLLDEQQFVRELTGWLSVTTPNKPLNPTSSSTLRSDKVAG